MLGRFAEYGIFRAAERFFRGSTKALEHSHYRPEPPVTDFKPVHGLENRDHTRLSGIYGDRLKIIGNGPVAEQRLRELELLPDSFHIKLAEYFAGHPEGGIYLVDGPVTEILTHLRGVRPRGWSTGKTWDNVYGACDCSTRRVVIGDGSGRSATRALHEVGHALDDALDRASETVVFRHLYSRADITRPYFAQPGRAGPEETFAEGLAAWARHLHRSPTYRAGAIAGALGIDTVDNHEAAALFDRYFCSLQRRLESHSN